MSAELRCALLARALGADPGGTAGSYDGWAVVACPLPWPRGLGEVEALAPTRAALGRAEGRIRLQAVVPVPGRPGAVLHRAGDGSFAGYRRSEGPDLGALLEAPLPPSGPGSSSRVGKDVLVCTHGRRDRCCGSLGTGLWQALDPDVGLGARVWRTSHTGGHRFAPTMVVLPEGTMWGWLDPVTARRIILRQGPVEDLLPLYRGCSGLGPAQAQVLERAVLGEVGWSLLDQPRRGTQVGPDRWSLDVGGVAPSSWEATLRPGRRVSVPPCGEPPEAATKSDTAFAVVDLVRTA